MPARWGRWALLILLLSGAGIEAQEEEVFGGFLLRPGLESYRNYAEYPYRPYRRQLRQDVSYNFFGDFLADGFHAFRLQEQRPGNSLIAKDEAFRSFFNNLVIANTSYGRLNAALTVGDEIRNVLTPLTMQQAGFSGMRWELEFPNNRLTLLAARGFDHTDFPGYESFSTPVRIVDLENFDTNRQTIRIEDNPVYTLGGHWETQVGDVLTLGATFLNQHQMNATVDRKDGFLHGGVPYARMLPPHVLMLRFTDDSPEDGKGGAAVFAVVLEIEATTGGVDTLLSSAPDSPHYSPALVPVRSGGLQVGGHWEANGEEELVYTFTLPGEITPRRARFIVVVANDYRIAAAQQHTFNRQERTTPFFTLKRADGNIRDLSNRRQVVLEYGLNSGQTLYGLDFFTDLVGLKVRGEVSMNALYRKFPVSGGENTSAHTRAWYLNGVKTFHKIRGLSVGGEFFYIGPRYGGGYDSRRGGAVLYTDQGGNGYEAVTAEYPLVEDNDDRDRYADDNRNDYPGATNLEAGVYPGLDEDHDNIPDDDRNANGVPDYQEPFLLYFSDPQEFVYGLDLNNNGTIDVRENDNKPDYPYDRDRQGQHFTVAMAPLPGLQIGAGHYRVETVTSRERAISTYLTGAYRYQNPRWGEVRLNHDSKRVEDDIPDSVYVFDPMRTVTPLDAPDPDLLLQRNSWVHTSFAGTRLTRFASLHIENNVKRVRNRTLDLKETPLSEKDQRTTLTLMNKADFRWQWGHFTVRPMYKRLWQRHTLKSRHRPLVETVLSAPILRVDFRLTDELLLQFGQQGIRLWGIDRNLSFRSIDKVEPFRSYSTTDFMVMFTLKGNYLGNTITTNTGIHLQNKQFDDPLAGEDQRFTRFFVDVVAGLERL